MNFQEIFIILLVALLAFGPKKIPMLIRHLSMVVKFINKIKLESINQIKHFEKYETLKINQQKAIDAKKYEKDQSSLNK